MAIKTCVNLSHAVIFLNNILAKDPELINDLIFKRFDCKDTILNETEIPTRKENGSCSVNIIGIINGLFGFNGITGPLGYVLKNDKIVEFVIIANE